MKRQISEKALDDIVNEMIGVVENSKDEILDISEVAEKEYRRLKDELEVIVEKVVKLIEKGDQLEIDVRKSRRKLSEVSKNFDLYSEADVHEVYQKTHQMQMNLAMLRQEEKILRERRDDIERRLVNLEKTLYRAENISRKISVVHSYLDEDFQHVNEIIEDAKEKQRFSLQIIKAQEEERLRISREIHDGPAQMLANILLRSEFIDQAYQRGQVEESLAEIKNIRKLVRSSLQEVRRIIYDLRPMVLDDLGLIPTIKKYINTLQDYNESIDITFTVLGIEERMTKKYEIALFRLTQEALQNAIRHAEAKSITVKLELRNHDVSLVIKDDGKGFDPKVKKEDSFGLIGMKERVEMFEGTFRIDSILGKGTTIYIRIPHISFENKIER